MKLEEKGNEYTLMYGYGVTDIAEPIPEKAGKGVDGVLFERVVVDVVSLERSKLVSHSEF